MSSEHEIYGTEGSPIDITFTLNTTQSLLDPLLRLDEYTVTYLFQFNLRIKNASKKDDGIYRCLVVTPWIDIVVARKYSCLRQIVRDQELEYVLIK